MKEIKLSWGKYITLVDDEDYDFLNQFRWQATKTRPRRDGTFGWYATRRDKERKEGGATIIRLHNVILPPPDGMIVDHKDGDGLNNQKSNLRIAPPKGNRCNSGSRGGSSQYKGVVYDKKSGYWKAEIKIEGFKRWLGTYSTERLAAEAHDCAAIVGHGEFAWLNFPDCAYSEVYEAFSMWVASGEREPAGQNLRPPNQFLMKESPDHLPAYERMRIAFIAANIRKAHQKVDAPLTLLPVGQINNRSPKRTALTPIRTKYRGASYRKEGNFWVGSIWVGETNYYLGCSQSDIECAEAADIATLILTGDRTKLNFPAKDYSAAVADPAEWKRRMGIT